MGTVYRAYDPRLQREVAIKLLRPELTTEPRVVRLFHREAVAAASLRHPNIVIVHDVGASDGCQYIVVELVPGCTLSREIQRQGPLTLHRAVRLLSQLASALDHAHQHGLVHRDVKSTNVIVGDNDHTTLTDFGLAKILRGQGGAITQPGLAIGTLNYMAPEQVVGSTVDHRVDVYALGVLAFEMLTGRLPFENESHYQTITAIIHTPPPSPLQYNPSLSPTVEPVLQRALAKDADSRFSSAGEMALTLRRIRATGGLQLQDSGGECFPLRAAGTSLGRGSDNDIVVRKREISRYHARIHCQAASWLVVDLGSTNGTFVNERRLASQVAHPLMSGDKLRLGRDITFSVAVAGTVQRSEAGTSTLTIPNLAQEQG